MHVRFTQYGLRRLAAAFAIIITAALAGGVVETAAPASASAAGPAACQPTTYWNVYQIGKRYYRATAEAVGKYNSSSKTAGLSLTTWTSKSRSTYYSAGASVSVAWSIIKVEAKAGVAITKTASSGRKVTDSMKIAGHHYGRMTPKVEYTNYQLDEYRQNGNCKGGTLIKAEPVFHAITANPYFAECQDTTDTCSPKP